MSCFPLKRCVRTASLLFKTKFGHIIAMYGKWEKIAQEAPMGWLASVVGGSVEAKIRSTSVEAFASVGTETADAWEHDKSLH